jgi:hypothetical protein
MTLKNTIAIFLIVIGVSAGILKKFQPNTIIDNNDIAILNIDKPEETILNLVTPIATIVTDPTDRAKLAIFNQEFSSRVPNYNTDNQHINDLYVLAAKKFFKGTIANKYENLDTSLKDMFELIITADNHQLSEEEKQKVSKTFSGFAWALIQKK